MADDVHEAATKEIEAFTSSMRNVQLEHFPGQMQMRIAIELIRLRCEMAAIRRTMEARPKIDGGDF